MQHSQRSWCRHVLVWCPHTQHVRHVSPVRHLLPGVQRTLAILTSSAAAKMHIDHCGCFRCTVVVAVLCARASNCHSLTSSYGPARRDCQSGALWAELPCNTWSQVLRSSFLVQQGAGHGIVCVHIPQMRHCLWPCTWPGRQC
jgi:hypothetical protein